jgi:hypothetical protein
MPLALVVPDLLLPADAPESLRAARLPRVERWLGRGSLSPVDARGAEAWLARAFGIEGDPAVAAVSLAADDAPREGTWLRADPVHLRLAQDAVTLHDAAALGVTGEEAAALVEALGRHFEADGLAFRAPCPERWYVRVPEGEAPATTPLADAVGRNVYGLLPKGTGRINWPAAITEAQMVMSAHPVNAEREAAGRPALNSVWFWGAGALPAKLGRPFSSVYASDAYARGLARIAGIPAHDLPAALDDIPAPQGGERALVVDHRLVSALRSGDAARWTAEAAAVEAAWFRSLGTAIGRFGSVQLVLPGAEDTLEARLDGASRWRWWRAPKRISTHA